MSNPTRWAIVLSLLAVAYGPAATAEPPRDSSASDLGPTIVDAPVAIDRGAAEADAPATDHANMIPPTLMPTDAARLIVMGDSISAGTGASRRPRLAYGGLLGANEATRWPDAASLDLAARFGHAVPVVNVAACGATTGSMRADQPGMLRTRLSLPVRGHSVVVITIGGNDLQLPTFVAGLDAWRARYMDLGRELGFGVIDALGHFHGHGHNFMHTDNRYFDRADASGWFSDCIHPNDRGHHELRRLFFEAIDGVYRVSP